MDIMKAEIYYVEETSCRNGVREGFTVEASSLTVAKRAATRRQVYQGTYLTLFDTHEGEPCAPIARKCPVDGWSTADGY